MVVEVQNPCPLHPSNVESRLPAILKLRSDSCHPPRPAFPCSAGILPALLPFPYLKCFCSHLCPREHRAWHALFGVRRLATAFRNRASNPNFGLCLFYRFPRATRRPPRHSLYYNLLMPANMLPALWRSSGVTFRALWRIARQVFHEFAGAMFIVFAVYGVMAAWRQWKTRPVLWLIGFAIVYALMMTILAPVPFPRPRRIR